MEFKNELFLRKCPTMFLLSMKTTLENYLDCYNLQDYVYPHQKDAIEWLYHRYTQKKGALLGDIMGFGKTLDICVLLQLVLAKTVLIVCTTSCIYTQWVSNLCKHSFYYKIYVLESNKVREITMDSEENLIKSDLLPLSTLSDESGVYKVVVSNSHRICPYPAVASHYEMTQPLDIYDPELTPLNDVVWELVIVDEVHGLRNGVNTHLDNEKRNKMLKYCRLSRLRMDPCVGVKIGLSGTPIQNRISDIVSILTFLGKTFSIHSEEEVKDAIKEYMFRRTDKNLHTALRTMIRYPKLDYINISKDVIYETNAESDIYKIVSGNLNGNMISSADNPYSKVQYDDNPLIKTCRECYLSADINLFIKIHNKAYSSRGIVLPPWHGSQSKLNMIVKDIAELAVQNASLICFTQFYSEMSSIKKRMKQKGAELGMGETMGYHYFEISGDVSSEDRYVVLKETAKLIKNGKRCICFATILACSDGLNMQHFSTAIFTTSDWNPANEDQAIARIFRPGQQSRVRVYRYIHRCIIENKNANQHIDLRKIKKQNNKKDKFYQYIINTENAAHHWPIRDMPGFNGEKCVVFPPINDLTRHPSSLHPYRA